jgi:hypothetical protein
VNAGTDPGETAVAVGLVDRTVLPVSEPVPAGPPPVEPADDLVAGTRALLLRARALIAAGWVQDAFYLVRGRRGELRPVSPFGLLLLTRADVVGACLVGAVSHASAPVSRRDRRGQAALAVDVLWEALAGAPVEETHPTARPGRVRELARWNDEPGRTREDVVGLLDRALDRPSLR